METELRKAIDKLPVMHKAHIYEPSIDAVAEISFKAGYDQALQDMRASLPERKTIKMTQTGEVICADCGQYESECRCDAQERRIRK